MRVTIASDNYFRALKNSLRVSAPEPFIPGTPFVASPGLRRAQVGAAFATVAHFTVSTDSAIVSMPTGSGKTAVMTLLPFMLGSGRVLVVTPSRLLREQLANEFTSLGILRRAGVLPEDTVGPVVKAATSRLRCDGDWNSLSEFDVVIGTPNVLSVAYADVASPPAGLFDLLVVDEAHHSAARTYVDLRRSLGDVRAVLFTATPFRRDRKQLPGVSVYTYSLGQALEDQVLAPIAFQAVETPANATHDQRDAALARAALRRLNTRLHRKANSRVIARTDSVAHARELVETYRKCGGELGLITANTGSREVRRTLGRVREGELRGFISVGVLGEGFDFPTLKVGVYHRRHASLPATLQFLGRLARILPGGPQAELLAIKEEVSDETRELYASDVAWSALVPALADAAVREEAERRRYVMSFDPLPSEPISLAAFRPRKDVQVFQLPVGVELNLRVQLEEVCGGRVVYQGLDDEDRLAVVVTEHLNRPQWFDANTLDSLAYEIHVVVCDQARSMAFVHGSRDSTVVELLAAFGYTDPLLVEPEWIDRLMASVALDNYHSVGMRSARAAGGRLAAYKNIAGPNVGTAVLPSETRSYGTGHAIARVRDPMNVTAQMVAAGVSPRSAALTSLGVSIGRAKVFSPDLAPLLEFRNWCDRLAALAAARTGVTPSGLPNLSLLSPRRIAAYPRYPHMILMDPILIGQGFRAVNTDTGTSAQIEELELIAERNDALSLDVRVRLNGKTVWRGQIDTVGRFNTLKGGNWVIQGPGGIDPRSLATFFEESPPSVFFADGTCTVGSVLYQARAEYPDLASTVLEPWGFAGVDIRAEAKDPLKGKTTIKEHVVSQLGALATTEYIVDDDRAGEVADLVVFSRIEASDMRHVSLVHCKYSSASVPGARVGDLYEVLGQAGRSVMWLNPARLATRLLARLAGGSDVVYGNAEEASMMLGGWAAHSAGVSWSIDVVQPGLKHGKVNSTKNIKIMLSDTLEWVAQHDAMFRVVTHT